MCKLIVDFEGNVIARQGELSAFLGYPVTMRTDAPSGASGYGVCLCWVDLDATFQPTGFRLAPAWDSHGVDYRLEPAAPHPPSTGGDPK